MQVWGQIPGALGLTDRLLRPPASVEVDALGLRFRSPLVLAAGVDKNSRAYDALATLGFGGIEIGTVTNFAQRGNEKPRMWRLPSEGALLNSMGFPNEGAKAQATRLKRRRTEAVLGVNIGKSKKVPVDDAVADYRATVRHTALFADYLAINVSSPNTEGLRGMQTTDQLADLVGGVRAELEAMSVKVPVLVKLGPDLPDDVIAAIGRAARSIGIDGLIAVNTTTNYANTPADPQAIARSQGKGGLSGRPLKGRALEVLSLLHDHSGDLPLVSVGGVESGEDVWRRILAGASLVQVHSAFVYEGPLWPHRVNKELAALLAASPYATLNSAIGKGGADTLDESLPLAPSGRQATAA
jgi:dihydroorotate dehydrogenase